MPNLSVRDITLEKLKPYGLTKEVLDTHWKIAAKIPFTTEDAEILTFLITGVRRGVKVVSTNLPLTPMQAIKEVANLKPSHVAILLNNFETGVRRGDELRWLAKLNESDAIITRKETTTTYTRTTNMNIVLFSTAKGQDVPATTSNPTQVENQHLKSKL